MEKNDFDSYWKEWEEQPWRFDNLFLTWDYKKPFLDLMVKLTEETYGNYGNTKVLEVGCGTAMEAYYIAKHTKAEVFAIDISTQAIEVAKKVGEKIGCQIFLKVDDATNMDFEDNSFHLVFSQGVVEHFHDPFPIMREQMRVLIKGGYLIVDVPQRYNIYTIYKKWKMKKNQWPYGWETEYSLRDLRKIGKKLGLKLITQTGWGNEILHFPYHRKFPVRILGKINLGINNLLKRYLYEYSPYYELCVTVVYEKK